MTAFNLTFGLALAAFFLLGPWLFYRRHFLLGAATMCIAAVAPPSTQVMLTDSDSPATVILAILMLPVPMAALVGRLAFLGWRGVGRMGRRADPLG